MINKGKANAVYVRARVCMYMCMCVWERERDKVTLIFTRKSMASLLVFLCPIISVDVGGRITGWEILAGPMRKGRGRERGASIIFSLPTTSGGASIIHLSQSGIGRSLAGKLRENIRTTVDKLLTSSFCAERDSRADIYKSRGSRIRFESPHRFFHKEGHSSNARSIKYL